MHLKASSATEQGWIVCLDASCELSDLVTAEQLQQRLFAFWARVYHETDGEACKPEELEAIRHQVNVSVRLWSTLLCSILS